jgi:uncharacterized protein
MQGISATLPNREVPASAGIGLRTPHIAEMLRRKPAIGWLEVHAENYMGRSAQTDALMALRADYPLSVHGVGLSLGSMSGIDPDHLLRLREVCRRFEPALVSEHLAWSSSEGVYLNDLLPLRYCEESLAIVARNIEQTQEVLGRRILVENLSAYVALAGSTMTEADFLAELSSRTGCGLLLDVNNVYVSAANLGFDAWEFIRRLPVEAIGEIHLAGHAINGAGEDIVLIDDHGSRVPPEVWALYARVIERTGLRPTLIEWDTALPSLNVLLGEASWADFLSRAITFEPRAQSKLVNGMRRAKRPALLPDKGVRLPALAACHAVAFRAHPSRERRVRHAFA